MAMNKMEGTKMVVRKLKPSGEVRCCGCIKIESKKVVDSSPSEEQHSFSKQKNGDGSGFPAKRKSVMGMIWKFVAAKICTNPTAQQ